LSKPKTVLLLVVVVAVVSLAAYVLGWVKTGKSRAREAIEAVDSSCLSAREHGGIDVARIKQYVAKSAIEELSYEDEPPYRAALDEAWTACVEWEIDNFAGPMPVSVNSPGAHEWALKRDAARHAVLEGPRQYFPYPDALPPGWQNSWR
jgi:hypothetical protein